MVRVNGAPRIVALLAGLLVTSSGPAFAQGGAAASAVAAAGRVQFQDYCAACHGSDAAGAGPVAAELRTPPPDLTRIAERRGGTFPLDELAEVIDGTRMIDAHGSRDMPVWGEAFAAEYAGEERQRELVRGKILMLLVYLESIQR
jgi:mono/diheme cytochrome c family protein